ncbi:PilZ domain-containing protein [Glaciecola sp. 1036]|uniref:PilZ domain-containing protein n=1 Tax=Alteromonadaceae TaxID=72275 RepID=UPI003D05E2F1
MHSLADKQAQFASFFLIQHPLPINLIPVEKSTVDVDMQSFERDMPYAFRIASEMSEIESRALKPFRNMGEKFEELVDYLQLQAKKMDLMMSYILQQQDDENYRLCAQKFGGGGISVISDTPVEQGQPVIIKMFLEEEYAAVFTYAEAINCEKSENDTYVTDYYFTHIREIDQELLVRASLHLQTKQLRKNKASKAE